MSTQEDKSKTLKDILENLKFENVEENFDEEIEKQKEIEIDKILENGNGNEKEEEITYVEEEIKGI
jgi:hypothetical protein